MLHYMLVVQAQPCPVLRMRRSSNIYIKGCRSLNHRIHRYHWSLLTGPKREDGGNTSGIRFHARNGITDGQVCWAFEQQECRILASIRLLARIRIAKVKDMDRLGTILHDVPVTPEVQGWNCVHWIRDALQRLAEDDGVLGGKSVLQWEIVRDHSMRFVQQVVESQRLGSMQPGDIDPSAKATLDLLDGGEFMP